MTGENCRFKGNIAFSNCVLPEQIQTRIVNEGFSFKGTGVLASAPSQKMFCPTGRINQKELQIKEFD